MAKSKRKRNQREQKISAPYFCIQKDIRPKDTYQKQFVESIKDNIVTFGFGEAGTGKTLLAVYNAMKLIEDTNSPIENLFYIRSNVGLKDEKDIGALPGDYNDKVNHLALPLYDNLIEFIPEQQSAKLFQAKLIEVSPMVYLRGRSLKNTLVIVDEAQNATYHQLKLVMSRLSQNSKIVLIGDPEQIDVKEENSGFTNVFNRVKKAANVGYTTFKINYRYQELQPILKLL